MDSNSVQPGATPGFSAKYFQGDEKMKYEVLFQPLGYTGQFEAGTSLLEAARRTGVFLEAPCGGNGRCGKCKVRLLSMEREWKEKEKEKEREKRERKEGVRWATGILARVGRRTPSDMGIWPPVCFSFF